MKNYLSFWFYQIFRRKYNETNKLDVLAHLENLQSYTKGKNVGSFIIYTRQSDLIGMPHIYSNLNWYDHPEVNTKLMAKFSLPVDGKERTLLQFSMGESLCMVGSYVPLTSEEKVVYHEILPFHYCSRNWRLSFSFFAERVTFIVDFFAKKDKSIAIDLLEEKIKTLLSKEQSESVAKGVRIEQNKLRKLKEEFNREYGHMYSL